MESSKSPIKRCGLFFMKVPEHLAQFLSALIRPRGRVRLGNQFLQFLFRF